MKKFFATSKNGVRVYLDTTTSHALTHFAHNPKLREVTRQLISEIKIKGEIIRINKDMGEIVGLTDLVETNKKDEIIYAIRPLREIYTRFVKGKKSSPTSWVTIDIRKENNGYFLYTAFVGHLIPSFPGGDYLSGQSKKFWSKHALVWGCEEIVSGTETKKCPW